MLEGFTNSIEREKASLFKSITGRELKKVIDCAKNPSEKSFIDDVSHTIENLYKHLQTQLIHDYRPKVQKLLNELNISLEKERVALSEL